MAQDSSGLGAFLLQARGERKRLSVTRAGGPDQALLNRYESGERLPSLQTLKWLCGEYGVDFKKAVMLLEQDRIARDLRSVA